jgi:hypothetical protein
MNLHVDRKLHAEFKALAARDGQRMTDLLVAFIKAYVQEHSASKLPRKGKAQ